MNQPPPARIAITTKIRRKIPLEFPDVTCCAGVGVATEARAVMGVAVWIAPCGTNVA